MILLTNATKKLIIPIFKCGKKKCLRKIGIESNFLSLGRSVQKFPLISPLKTKEWTLSLNNDQSKVMEYPQSYLT